MMCCIVNQQVYVGQRKVVLRAHSIKISVVDAHMDVAVLFGYRDNVRYPLRIVAYFNKSSIDQLNDLLLDLKDSVWVLPSQLLPLGSKLLGVDRYVVLHYQSV